jgi:hypothetical protein
MALKEGREEEVSVEEKLSMKSQKLEVDSSTSRQHSNLLVAVKVLFD